MFGYHRSIVLKSVDCYDASLDKWSPVAEMSEYRWGHGVVVSDGVMYAVGGYNESGHLKSAEAFRPSTGLWYSITDMHMCRTYPGEYNNFCKNVLNFKLPLYYRSFRIRKFIVCYWRRKRTGSFEVNGNLQPQHQYLVIGTIVKIYGSNL